MTTNATKLRESIAQSRVGQSRWRCPSPLRKKIVEFAKERRQAGSSVRKIARELGVSESGLSRWLQSGSGRVRPVRVAEEGSSQSPLVLVSPGGYRLEGLSPSDAAEVLRRLGC